MKFRVGDKVRIKRIDGTSKKSSYFIRFAKIYEGAVFTVTDITECSNGILYEGKENPYKWDEEMLELADDSSTDPSTHPLDASTGMSAVEVLEWFKHLYQSDDYNDAFADMLDGYGISDLFEKYSPQEIVDKIAAYEAKKKAPKPVEVEYGWKCEIFRQGEYSTILDEREMWEGDEVNAMDEAAERARQYAIENGVQIYFRVYGICRVKEDKD